MEGINQEDQLASNKLKKIKKMR